MEECPLFLLFICFFLQGLVGVILDGSKFSALHTVSGIKDTKNIPRPRTKIAVPKQRQLVSNSVSFTSFQYKRAETVLNLGTHVSQPCATGSSCTPASRIALPPCHPGALSHLLPQELRTSANGSCCPTSPLMLFRKPAERPTMLPAFSQPFAHAVEPISRSG